MKARRGLALVMTVVASAAAMTSAAATASAPAAAGASSGKPTICVALVVDGRSIGSDVSTSCAKVSKGSTGVDVLEKAGHTVGFRSDGLLCTIDGLPKGGCSTVTDTHYWAYFHRAPGATKWVYSSEGASTYEPVNASTEGWVYDDGKALTPENVPYDQICKSETTPSPSPTRSATPTPRPAPTHRKASASATPSPTATASAVPPRHHPRRSRRAHPTTPATSQGSVTAAAASPSATSAALVGGTTPPANHHGRLDLLIGLVIVTAIGISAAVRFRRSSR